VGGAGYNSYDALAALPEYADPNLLYTFHFYDPYLFTHQGKTWGTPDMSGLRGVPFPFPKDNVDWVCLKDRGYALRFKVKTDNSVSFDVRFVNPDNAASVPWRMNCAVASGAMPPDGQWHVITIPFGDMREQGAWLSATGEWRSPGGQFSWENIASLSIVAETGPITGSIRFDSIEVVKP
jgi:hypothetical protein